MRNVFMGLALVSMLFLTACGTPAGNDAEPEVALTESVGEPASSDGSAEGAATTAAGAATAEKPADEPVGAVPDLGGREIVIGTDATYPPFESVSDNGAIEGVDPSVMAAICELANCVARFENTAWDGIFPALAAGEFDVLMSAITILPEREAGSDATFTDPYFQVGQVVLVRADETAIAAAEDLVGGAAVAVQTGTTGDTAATETLGVAEDSMLRFATIVDAVQALLNGDADAVVLDSPTAAHFLARHEGELMLIGEPFTTEDYGILVPNDRPELLAAFNAAIAELQASGAIETLAAEWFAVSE